MKKKNMLLSSSIGLLSAITALFSTLFLGGGVLPSVLIAILPVLFGRAVFGKVFLEHVEKYYGSSVLLQTVILASVRFYPEVYQDIVLQVLEAFTSVGSGPVFSIVTSFEAPILTLIAGILLVFYREGFQSIVLEKL